MEENFPSQLPQHNLRKWLKKDERFLIEKQFGGEWQDWLILVLKNEMTERENLSKARRKKDLSLPLLK